MRRVVAVTGAEASEAIEAGRQLQQRTADAQKLPSDKLEREVAALKRVSGSFLWKCLEDHKLLV